MKLYLSLSLSLLITLSSCANKQIKGSKTIIKKDLNLSNFNSINVSSVYELDLVQSDTYKVTFECNDNIEKFIDVNVKGKTLMVGLKGSQSYKNLTLKIIIHAPDIESIKASGATEINIKNFNFNSLTIDLSGASDLDAILKVKEQLVINASGASEIKMKGKAKTMDLDFSGASDFDGKELVISEMTNIDASGASEIEVYCNGVINIDASGASEIKHFGNGKIKTIDISGASSVKKG